MMAEDRFTKLGYELPLIVAPDKCNACGVCAWMCPEYAIAVYKYAPVGR
jgi:NAD-dependent dihydropyrimidine dehydrogenase PreA subunit